MATKVSWKPHTKKPSTRSTKLGCPSAERTASRMPIIVSFFAAAWSPVAGAFKGSTRGNHQERDRRQEEQRSLPAEGCDESLTQRCEDELPERARARRQSEHPGALLRRNEISESGHDDGKRSRGDAGA